MPFAWNLAELLQIRQKVFYKTAFYIILQKEIADMCAHCRAVIYSSKDGKYSTMYKRTYINMSVCAYIHSKYSTKRHFV